MTTSALPDDLGVPEEVVLGFLLEVRSGIRLDRVHRYLAPLVQAHQGSPGAVRAVVERTPDEYAAHVREMLRTVGPWRFEVLGVASDEGRVEAAWRQTGAVGTGGSPGRRVVEHGRATYLVEGGRITEYWIDASQEVVP